MSVIHGASSAHVHHRQPAKEELVVDIPREDPANAKYGLKEFKPSKVKINWEIADGQNISE